MTLSQKLNKELNGEFTDAQAYTKVMEKHIYGSNKRCLELKKQARAAKLMASL